MRGWGKWRGEGDIGRGALPPFRCGNSLYSCYSLSNNGTIAHVCLSLNAVPCLPPLAPPPCTAPPLPPTSTPTPLSNCVFVLPDCVPSELTQAFHARYDMQLLCINLFFVFFPPVRRCNVINNAKSVSLPPKKKNSLSNTPDR